jgi:putative oxidoreductase
LPPKAVLLMVSAEDLRSLTIVVFRFIVALVWIAAGLAKLRSYASARNTVQRLTHLPHRLAACLAAMLAPGEIALGLLLLTGWRLHLLAAVSACLFTLFAILVAAAAVRGALAEGGCGCFGGREAITSSGNPASVGRLWARNLVLALLALAVACRP